ncbi:MAG: hypothetical protein JRE70_14200 [Deltaproteobacteria bacterium]|nr:hypothetical protein [Deltaproteobacteria bacterium]
MLSEYGFDPANDVQAITVNRWPHGCATHDTRIADTDGTGLEPLYVRSRRPHWRITIANSGAGGRAYLDCAIDQAHRAIAELELPQAT